MVHAPQSRLVDLDPVVCACPPSIEGLHIRGGSVGNTGIEHLAAHCQLLVSLTLEQQAPDGSRVRAVAIRRIVERCMLLEDVEIASVDALAGSVEAAVQHRTDFCTALDHLLRTRASQLKSLSLAGVEFVADGKLVA